MQMNNIIKGSRNRLIVLTLLIILVVIGIILVNKGKHGPDPDSGKVDIGGSVDGLGDATGDEASLNDVINIFNEKVLRSIATQAGREKCEAEGVVIPSRLNKDSNALAPILEQCDGNENGKFTRIGLVSFISRLLDEMNAEPAMYNYKLNYIDLDQIDREDIHAVSVVACIGIYNRSEFEPNKVVTIDELQSVMDELRLYIDRYRYTPSVVNIAKTYSEDMLNDISDMLKGREVIDRLNGQSVAIYKKPEDLTQIKDNIDGITRLKITDGMLNTDQSVEYINIDEGIVNYNKLDEITLGNADNIVGITVAEPEDFSIVYNSYFGATLVSSDELLHENKLSSDCLGFTMLREVLAFRDDSIVSIGQVVRDESLFDGIRLAFSSDSSIFPIDAIGVIVARGVLENNDNTDLIIIKIPIK